MEAATEERIERRRAALRRGSPPRVRLGRGLGSETMDMYMWARMWGGEPFEELTMQDFAATWGLDCAVEVQLFAEVAQYTGGVECF